MTDQIDNTDNTEEFDEHDLEHVRKLRGENKNLRDRAKAAETALEQANTRIQAHHRSNIERIASASLKDARDLWSAGLDVSDFLTDDGDLDETKITTATAELIADRPHWAAPPATSARPPTDRPIEGLRAGASPSNLTPPPAPTWSDALRNK